MKKEEQLFDSWVMKKALALARRGKRAVCPNPQVGAIVTCQGKIESFGWHQKAGLAHAEVNALSKIPIPKDSTLYVTLEPCNHTGATPPCTEALINAGIKRVVIAMEDPNNDVRGGGIEKLREQGIKVEIGCLESDAQELLKPWTFWLKKKRPYIYAVLCFSLDGKVLDPEKLLIENKDLNYYFQKQKDKFDLIIDQRNCSNFETSIEQEFFKLGENNVQILLSLEADLNRKLFLKNLVNELVIVHFPVILGHAGKTFLDGVDLTSKENLKLKATKRFRSLAISSFDL